MNKRTTKQKIINKMAVVSHYLSIITLNEMDETHQSKDRMAEWIKKFPNSMLAVRNLL